MNPAQFPSRTPAPGRRLFWWWGTALLFSSLALGADNMHFRGALVTEPCVVAPGDEHLALDFGNVVDKYLYQNQRSPSQVLVLHLQQCDSTLAKSFKVTFNGTQNPALPGLLALDPGSQASGLAIGLETAEGRPWPLNQPGAGQALVAGDNQIEVRAYLQGEPAALANRSIEKGPFTAPATFRLDYE